MNTVLSDEWIRQIYLDKATNHPTEALTMPRNIAIKQDAHTRLELAKAVRKMSPINAVGFQQAVLKLLEQ